MVGRAGADGEWRKNSSGAQCRVCGIVPQFKMSMFICSSCATERRRVFWKRRQAKLCEPQPNRKQAKCSQCGVVPSVRMSHKVCVDCAQVNRLIYASDQWEARKVKVE